MHPLIKNALIGEIIISSTEGGPPLSKAISAAVKAGELTKIAPKIYSTSVTAPTESVVSRNLYHILGALYPGAVISHRSALEGGAKDSHIVLTYKYTKKIRLPGVTIHLFEGLGAIEGDMTFVGGLFMSSQERSWLENCEQASGHRYKKCLSKTVFEGVIEQDIRNYGEDSFRKKIDRVHAIANELGLDEAAVRFQRIAGAILGTRPTSELTTANAIARARGFPIDPDRIKLFECLYTRLRHPTKNAITPFFLGTQPETFIANLCFFDAYFSNYIEGTKFEVSEARDMVFQGKVPPQRPDGHDVVATFRSLYEAATSTLSNQTPFNNAEEFIEWLKERHFELMAEHPEKNPGEFKNTINMAGSTTFVAPTLVTGTLKRGFEYYPSLPDGIPKALFLQFLVSEIHPFADGNGRMSRITMNWELYRAGLWPIIIPTVFRTDYLGALRKLTRQSDPDVLISAMEKAAQFTCSIDFSTFEGAVEELELSNAFSEDSGVLLIAGKKDHGSL